MIQTVPIQISWICHIFNVGFLQRVSNGSHISIGCQGSVLCLSTEEPCVCTPVHIYMCTLVHTVFCLTTFIFLPSTILTFKRPTIILWNIVHSGFAEHILTMLLKSFFLSCVFAVTRKSDIKSWLDSG
jgi:hypothetical protein